MKKTAIKRILTFILVIMMILPIIPAMPASAAVTTVTLANNDNVALTVTQGDTINLSWTNINPSSASNYVCQLLVKTANNTSTTTAVVLQIALAGTTGTSTSFWWIVPMTLAPGTYWVEVRAFRSSNSTWSPANNSAAQRMKLTVLEKPLPPDPGLPANMRDITTQQIVYDMGIGINLGNTLEACGDWVSPKTQVAYETCWGSPIITEEMIAAYAAAGFRSVRIPVAWSNLMQEDYTIHPDLMNRVQQIVDWVIGNGMYALVNIHWDNGWIENLFPSNEAEAFKKYESIWTQISERFKDYNDYLMFESMNEPGFDAIWDQYSGTAAQKSKAFNLINRINQKFVDIFRESGGGNAYRHLLISAYYTNIDHSTNGLTQMPFDPRGRCAISVHYYGPWNWVGLEKDESWGKAQWTWGTASDVKFVNDELNKVYNYYVKNGVPVIIGEYAMCSNKNKPDSDRWTIMVTEEIFKRDMCPMLWDIQFTDYQLATLNQAFYDRRTQTYVNPEVLWEFQRISATRAYSSAAKVETHIKPETIQTIDYKFYNLGVPVVPAYLTFTAQFMGWEEVPGTISPPQNGACSVTLVPSAPADGLANLGWISRHDGTEITLKLDKITINETYELTRTSPYLIETKPGGADGLPNIWWGDIAQGAKLFTNAAGNAWLAWYSNDGI